MPRTALDVQTITSAYPLTADGTDTVTYQAFDLVEGNYYSSTGREVLVVHNTSPDTGLDFTITSVADHVTGRTADVVHTLAAEEEAVYYLATKGFRKPNRTIEVSAEDPGVDEAMDPLPGLEIAVIRLPR